MNRVLMYPTARSFGSNEGGIRRVVEAYERYLPRYGWEVTNDENNFDISAVHAGTASRPPDVAHLHGAYFTFDYDASPWEWKANAQVMDGARKAMVVTVPSKWVAETFQRGMRLDPVVIPHGIEWEQYTPEYSGSYVLWNKNRTQDSCDPTPVGMLAKRAPDVNFLSTFSNTTTQNIRVTGAVSHDDMIDMVRGCCVYLATVKETFSIGTLEAMALGKPVLAFAYGGLLNLVQHKVNGYLVEPGNYEELEIGLRYCMAHARELGENSRHLVQRFTWPKAAKMVADVYDQCLIERDSHRPLTIDPGLYEH